MAILPVALMRRRIILRRLAQCNARSEATAVSLKEAGILNPEAFKALRERMIERGEIGRTSEGRYYIIG